MVWGGEVCRSDGYSCQREQVTEGIFRHVHPMTQQLLIMWEEPPRIVLVLKKLGRALLPQLCEVRERAARARRPPKTAKTPTSSTCRWRRLSVRQLHPTRKHSHSHARCSVRSIHSRGCVEPRTTTIRRRSFSQTVSGRAVYTLQLDSLTLIPPTSVVTRASTSARLRAWATTGLSQSSKPQRFVASVRLCLDRPHLT